MIIDLILDVQADPASYVARDFYADMNGWRGYGWMIARAMDSGKNEDVQNELCRYVIENEYNPQICRFILDFNWI